MWWLLLPFALWDMFTTAFEDDEEETEGEEDDDVR